MFCLDPDKIVGNSYKKITGVGTNIITKIHIILKTLFALFISIKKKTILSKNKLSDGKPKLFRYNEEEGKVSQF